MAEQKTSEARFHSILRATHLAPELFIIIKLSVLYYTGLFERSAARTIEAEQLL